jgi:DNA processing protein
LYPSENIPLFERILSEGRGAIISELPMRIGVKPGNFPRRNRIISGLSLGVLVVEAALRSGSLITARLAVEQGKEVFAIPGPVDSAFSQGTNRLIASSSAALVTALEDILEGLDRVGEVLTEAGAIAPHASPAAGAELTPVEAALMVHLTGGELGLDELVRRSGMPSSEVTSTMTMLAIKGAVIQRPGGLFTARPRGN